MNRNSLRLESAETSGKYKESSHVIGFQKAGSGRQVKTFNYKPLTDTAQQRGLPPETQRGVQRPVKNRLPGGRLTCKAHELFINPRGSGYFPF